MRTKRLLLGLLGLATACGGSSGAPSEIAPDMPVRTQDAGLEDAAPVTAPQPMGSATVAMPMDAGTPDAASTLASMDAAVDSSPTTGELTIPVTITTPATGQPFVTVQVSVGGSAPFTALVDTGSAGLRVVQGTVPDSAWAITTTPTSATYGSGLVADGVVVNAVVVAGGVSTTTPIALTEITSVGCDAAHPNCSAAGESAASFRFAGGFPAIFGVGLRSAATTGIASPLASMGHNRQYIFSLPPFGGTSGTLTLDPSPASVARFQNALVQLGPSMSMSGTTASGIKAWDDTKIPFCINALCATGILDTGGTTALDIAGDSDDAALGIASGSSLVPPGSAVTVTIDKTAAWSFTVGKPPAEGKDRITVATGTANDNLGVMPFHQLDVFYDYAGGRIGLASKL